MANLTNINGYFNVSTVGTVNVPSGSFYVTKTSGDAIAGIISSGGSGKPYYLRSNTNGSFAIYDDTACLERLTISSGGNATFSGEITSGDDINSGGKVVVNNPSGERKIQFIRTGGKTWSIEHDSASIYFYNITDTKDVLLMKNAGQIMLGEYGSGTFTGTTAYNLAVDSSGNIIETTDGGGTVKGTGTATRVAFWSASDTISSNADLYWDNSNDRLGLGTTNPTHTLHVKNSSGDVRGIMIEQAESASYAEIALKSDIREFRLGTAGDGTNNANAENLFYIYDATTGGVAGHRFEIDSNGDVQARRPRSNTAGDVALSLQPTDTTAHYGWRIDQTSNNLNLDYVNTPLNIMSYSTTGNVGIGTTLPTEKLSINAGVAAITAGPTVRISKGASPVGSIAYDTLVIEADDVPTIRFGENDGTVSTIMSGDSNLRINSTSPIKFYTAGTTTGPGHSGQGGTFAMIINNSQNVGIGTTTPQTTLEVDGADSALNAHFGQGQNNSSGVFGGISLGYAEANTSYRKVGIVAKALGDGAARQNLHFLVDTVSDAGSAGLADSKMQIDGLTGYVSVNERLGVGTTNPSGDLDVAGPYAFFGTEQANNGTTHLTLRNYDSTLVDAGDIQNMIRMTGRYWSGATSQLVETRLLSIKQISNGNGGSALGFATQTGGSTPVEHMRIDKDGNVGIGEATPAAKLDVKAASNEHFLVSDSLSSVSLKATNDAAAAYVPMSINGSTLAINGDSNGAVSFGTGAATFAGDITSVGLTVDYTGNRTGDAGILVTNDGSDWGIKVDKDSTTDYGILSQTDGDNAIVVRNAAGTTNIQLQGDGDATFAGDVSISNTNGNLNFTSGNGVIQTTTASTSLTFGVNGSEKMRIHSTGDVLIGATDPTSYNSNADDLIIYEANDFSGMTLAADNDQGSNIYFADPDDDNVGGITYNHTSNYMMFRVNGASRAEIDSGGSLTMSGDVIAYGSPSDKRLKENIKPIKSALDKVNKLQGVTFNWKKSNSILDIKEDIGFIAQDVQKVIPELVRENEDGMLSMRHQGIAPILLEAIKELKAEIEELKKQVKK